jgi:4-hydroxyphenylpyruvate dioxygenase
MAEDFLPINRVDHVELYVGNAKQAAFYYQHGFGFTPTAYSGLETNSRQTAGYVLEQHNIRLVLTSALGPDNPVARHVQLHGDSVAVIALEVPDVEQAYAATIRRGATGALPPREDADEHGALRTAAIRAYGDTLIKFVDRTAYRGAVAPGFRPRPAQPGRNGKFAGIGLMHIDHIVGNVELGAMNRWVQFFAETLGFQQLVHFSDDDISTEYSALMSKVMTNGNGKIKFPINEPAEGKRRSQIQEYLDFHYGPGVQHLALSTTNIIETVARLRQNGITFLSVPSNYYDHLEERVGQIAEPIARLAELGVLVDRDEEGYLLQIFTKPVQDRPTLFFEIIERHGSQGFGAGNFKALFEALEREQALRGNL